MPFVSPNGEHIVVALSVRLLFLSGTLHKNCNSALPNFGVVALCSFLHFELCPRHNSETTRGIKKKICRYVGVQYIRTVTLPSLILELVPFVHINILKFVHVTASNSMKMTDLELHIITLCRIW